MPLLLIAGLATVLLAAALLATRRRATVGAGVGGTDVSAAMRPIVRRSTITRFAGFGIGLAAAAAILTAAPPNWLGLEAALAAPAFALCLLAGVLIGEITGTVPTGPDRAAPIEVRSVRSYLPRFMTGAVIVLGAVLAVLLTATSLMGSADDMSRAGRFLTLNCQDLTASTGPWPGVYYSLPIAASVLIGIAAAAPTLHAVTRRRRPASGDAVRAADDDARRASARAIVAACGVLVAAPLTGTGLYTGMAMTGNACATAAVTAFGWTALALGLTAFIASCWFAAMAVFPYRAAQR
ncbi:hypothetical protein O1R50_23525 [Glycomyces luteolus]|uniref:Uncharacterized protein n=1 Tax=Glycomyces luteolus TaxID=2670330 RepID=A0A9X3PF75_9ACTN|nr:hypothetical protein [Glycomyces luteolus]MDA1362612.1 hypothetical protein [Glycomyces luteolus]